MTDVSAWPRFHYVGTLARVKDGDTAVLRLDLGFSVSVEVSVRIAGLNTPELRGPDKERAERAKEGLADLLSGTCYVRTHKDARSFERYVADVYVVRDGRVVSVAEQMVAAGLGEKV